MSLQNCFATGSALDICFNAIAILFTLEVDNIAYQYGLPEQIRARVEESGHLMLSREQREALSWKKTVFIVAIPIALVVGPSLMTSGDQLTYLLAVPSPVVVYILAGIVEQVGSHKAGGGGLRKLPCIAGKVVCSTLLGGSIYFFIARMSGTIHM